MSNFERDVANTMLDAADARIASLEADKADLLRVLGVADEKIRSGEDARGQYIRENAALEARLAAIQNRVPYICSFCNWTTDSIANGEGHMKVCEKHPMRALEARFRELETERDRLRATMIGPMSNWTWGQLYDWIDRRNRAEAALHKIVDEGDYTAPEGIKRIARSALETAVESADDPKCAEASWVIENGIAVCENCRRPVDEIFAAGRKALDEAETAVKSGTHPSHKIRASGVSAYDEICEECGYTDSGPEGTYWLTQPCKAGRAAVEPHCATCGLPIGESYPECNNTFHASAVNRAVKP